MPEKRDWFWVVRVPGPTSWDDAIVYPLKKRPVAFGGEFTDDSQHARKCMSMGVNLCYDAFARITGIQLKLNEPTKVRIKAEVIE